MVLGADYSGYEIIVLFFIFFPPYNSPLRINDGKDNAYYKGDKMSFHIIITDGPVKVSEADIQAENAIEAGIIAQEINDTYYLICSDKGEKGDK